MKKILFLFTLLFISTNCILADTFNIDEYYNQMKKVQANHNSYYLEGNDYATIGGSEFKIYKKANKYRIERTSKMFDKPTTSTKIYDGKNLYNIFEKSNVAYKETRFMDKLKELHLLQASVIFDWNENFIFDFVDTGKKEIKNGFECRMLKATHFTTNGHEYCVSDKYGILISSDAKDPKYKTTTDVTMIKVGDEFVPDEAFQVPKGMTIKTFEKER